MCLWHLPLASRAPSGSVVRDWRVAEMEMTSAEVASSFTLEGRIKPCCCHQCAGSKRGGEARRTHQELDVHALLFFAHAASEPCACPQVRTS